MGWTESHRGRVEVRAVDVVREDGRHGDGLGGPRGDDGHEEHDGDHVPAEVAEEVNGHGRRDEPGASLTGSDRELERQRAQAHRGGEGERDPGGGM